MVEVFRCDHRGGVQSICIQPKMYMEVLEVLCIACAYRRLFFEDQKVAVCFVPTKKHLHLNLSCAFRSFAKALTSLVALLVNPLPKGLRV